MPSYLRSIIFIIILAIAILIQYGRYKIQNATPKKDGFLISHSKPPYLLGVKNVLLIGGTGGIGRQLAESLIKRNIHVTVVGRSRPKEKEFMDNVHVKFISSDLTSMKVAKDLAETLKDEKFDVIFFTTGTAHFHLEHTKEGIESDLAISYLSRQVLLDGLIGYGLDRVTLSSGRNPRVFLMGGPGMSADPSLEDINWEDPEKFKSLPRHMNTHIFNEALVHHYAVKYPSIEFFGLYPGIIVTTGIENLLGNGTFLSIVKPLINLLFQTVEYYSENILVPLLASPEIKSGSLFNSLGNEIETNTWFNEDLKGRSKQLVTLNHELLKKKNL